MKKIFTLVLICIFGVANSQINFTKTIVTDQGSYDGNTVYVAVADIDGDGKQDVVSKGFSKIMWHKNIDAQGAFGRAKTILSSQEAKMVITGDIDGDGDQDVIFHKHISQSQSIQVCYMKNDGIGNFGAVTVISTFNDTTADVSNISLKLADMDADGKPDMVFISGFNICWSKNINGSDFAPAAIIAPLSNVQGITYTCADFTGDGLPDLVYNHSNSLFMRKNNGNGNFGVIETIDPSSIGYNIAAADMDNDGLKDIVFVRQEQDLPLSLKSIVWYKNIGGQFSARQTLVSPLTVNNEYDQFWLEIADFDDDGKQDIALSGKVASKVSWYKNSGNAGLWTEQVINQELNGIVNFAVGHIDDNGRTDIITASPENNRLQLYKNMAGGFAEGINISSGTYHSSKIDAGDIDGDGDVDLLFASVFGDKLGWYKNNNGQGFAGNYIVITDTLPDAVNPNLVDIDNDGDLDIIANTQLASGGEFYTSLQSFTNNGQGQFTQQQISPLQLTVSTYTNHFLDIDNDGDIDIAAYSYPNLQIYKNNGNGTFAAPYNAGGWPASSPPFRIFFGDIDNDAYQDLLIVLNPFVGPTWYKNSGSGTFGNPTELSQAIFGGYTIADINDDGMNDLVSTSENNLAWYRGTGMGNFAEKVDISTSGSTASITFGDVDGDGDLDIIQSRGMAPNLVWYQNLGNGIFNRQTVETFMTTPDYIEVTDINADGKIDIIASASIDSSINWFKNSGINMNTISGTVRFDIDTNGCSASDVPVPQVLITTQSGSNTRASFTNANGSYAAYGNQGTFTTSIANLPGFNANPQSQQSVFTANTGGNAIANFCLQALNAVTDLQVNIYRLADVRPGFPVQYRVVVKNNGTTQVAGSATVNFDNAKLNFNSAAPLATSQTGNTSTFDLGTMLPFAVKEFSLNFTAKTIPTISLGDEVILSANVTIANDATPANNTAQNTTIVVGSYDPNDIAVREGSQILLEDADEYLHYLIRFQNTGNYYAERVVVKNPLDSKLDWTTMQIESMSHTGRAEIINGAEATFTFDAIYLPAMTVNEPASHGYIAYKIKPKANVALGDTFTEQAHIYFDFNPAIDTNIVTTTIVDNVNGVPQFTAETVSVYPVPSRAILNVKANSDIAKIEIYNQAGQRVHANTMQNSIDISALSHGIYFAKIENVHGSSVTKKVVKN